MTLSSPRLKNHNVANECFHGNNFQFLLQRLPSPASAGSSRIASQVALGIKNLPANVGGIRDAGLILGYGRSPGGGHSNPLRFSILAWRLPWTEESAGPQPIGSKRVGSN